MIHDALTQKLLKLSSADVEENGGSILQSRFNAILVASISPSNDTPLTIREEDLVRSIILAHHPTICVSFALLSIYASTLSLL
jgi:hypothetical protein